MREAVLETLRDPAGGAVQGNEVLACRGSSPCPAEARPHPPCCRAFFLAFLYLVFFHYRIEPHFRRSIVINAAMTFGAFATAVRIIPCRVTLRAAQESFRLFKIIPCPTHHLPRFDPQTGILTGSKAGTLENLFLRLFGRCTENILCIILLIFQAFLCLLCFCLRHVLAGWYK
ncbi:hypothetical protein OPV22_005769 [Ensete ventricosum]|uniref:Uncharacterized protein n=1 Tax=Ensete ventricosum TaxID=4639 RepID=A0AAV8RRS5_ENSVE|nr:hypothetical protein OPV22_005769 [Ensete ventricosum]